MTRTAICRTINLRDGRLLAYADVGDRDGTPIVFFHGNDHCRLGRHPDDGIALRLGVRLIAVDRPGVGRSTKQHERTLRDLGWDVEQLADALQLPEIGIVGWSSGASFAAACAHALPDRVRVVAIVSGLASLGGRRGADGMQRDAELLLRLAGLSPVVMRVPLTFMCAGATHNPALLMRMLYRDAPACDRRILAEPDIQRMFTAAYREAARGGAGPLAHELSLLARPWGFDLEEIRQPVAVYHGDADRLVPLSMGRRLADRLPCSTLEVFRDEGHQLIWPRWEMVLRETAAAMRAVAPRATVPVA